MRIALIHYSAPPVIGGVERVIEQQARILAENGHEVAIICGNAEADVRVRGCSIHVVDWSVKSVRRALSGCQVVLVHNMFTMPFHDEAAQVLAGLSREFRMVNWVHDVDVSPLWFNKLGLVAKHIAVSEVRKTLFCDVMGITVEACQVIPNGIDIERTLGLTPRVSDLIRRHHLFEREVVIFHPTRILARKNIELGIEVTAALRKAGVDVAYVVSGAPDLHRPSSAAYSKGLRQLEEDRSVGERVIFAGDYHPLGEEEVRSLYQLADIIFFPSRTEGFGLPLLEAALHRVPILCSDIPPHREIGTIGCDFFSLNASPTEIATQMRSILDGDRMVQARRLVMQNASWERIYHVYLEPLLKAV